MLPDETMWVINKILSFFSCFLLILKASDKRINKHPKIKYLTGAFSRTKEKANTAQNLRPYPAGNP